MSANKVSLTLKLTIFITSASTHISKALQNAAENTVADVCVWGGGEAAGRDRKPILQYLASTLILTQFQLFSSSNHGNFCLAPISISGRGTSTE